MRKFSMTAENFYKAVTEMCRHRASTSITKMQAMWEDCGVVIEHPRPNRVCVSVPLIPITDTRTSAYLHQNITQYLIWGGAGANPKKKPQWVRYYLKNGQIVRSPKKLVEPTAEPVTEPVVPPVVTPVAEPAVSPGPIQAATVAQGTPACPQASRRSRRRVASDHQIDLWPTDSAAASAPIWNTGFTATPINIAPIAVTPEYAAGMSIGIPAFIGLIVDKLVAALNQHMGERLHAHLGKVQREIKLAVKMGQETAVGTEQTEWRTAFEAKLADMRYELDYVKSCCQITPEKLQTARDKAARNAAK